MNYYHFTIEERCCLLPISIQKINIQYIPSPSSLFLL